MKNKFTLLTFSVLFLVLLVPMSYAQTATPTADLQGKAQKLLELVASDTARLNLTEKRGIIGTVTDTSSTQIKIEDVQGNTRFIDVDELTKFSSPDAKGSFGISDIESGSTIGALGLYNKSSRRLLARFVNVMTIPQYVHGAVTIIDTENFAFNVETDTNKTLGIDVETVTKTNSYTLEEGLVRSGFSKITEGTNVVIVGYSDIKEANKILASFIFLFPDLPKNPAINVPGSNSS
ncbi:MAG: hypothetical protein WD967_01390, partial [Candidatus Levyibacteriota bacterium]